MNCFREIGCVMNKDRGGSLIGDQVFALFNYPEICDIFMLDIKPTKGGRKPGFGSQHLIKLMKSYINLRHREFELTCKPRDLCWHEILELESLLGNATRIEAQIFPNCVPLDSNHYRSHLVEALKSGCGIVNSDRFTERGHQLVIKINNRLKRMSDGARKLRAQLNLAKMQQEKEMLPGRIKSRAAAPDTLSGFNKSTPVDKKVLAKKNDNKTSPR